jgi:hypothetical protein
MKEADEVELEYDHPGALTVHDIDPREAERIRTLAHSILAGHRARAGQRAGISHFYARFLEPALVSCITVLYLSWAVGRALLFYGIHR